MLRILRVCLGCCVLAAVTVLFLDVTGALHDWLGWLPRIQFVPALMALNVGVLVVLALVTLLFGRVYCSVICPLGIMQDVISHLSGLRKKARRRFSYSPALNGVRYGVLLLFVLAFLGMLGSVAGLLAPYSAYGRMVSQLLAPLYRLGNNALAALAERMDSYAFCEVDVWAGSVPTFAIALGSFVFIAVLAWRHGRTYCNTICPVGTLLGMLSRVSLFAPRIDTAKCVSCGLCARQCKASCIDPAEHRIDGSRCVACMNCLSACHKGAISYGLRRRRKGAGAPEAPAGGKPVDASRRQFLKGTGFALATAAAAQPEKLVDGGLAPLAPKVAPQRRRPLLPPGATLDVAFKARCTGCQLCVSTCPHGVLRPSSALERLMQPERSYERGFCPPECTACTQVCPNGAMRPLSVEEKYSTSLGHAVWVKEHCVVLRDGVPCGACARHCPVGAIVMVPLNPDDPSSPSIPTVLEYRCIACGKCEHLCPARPHSAIYVEGDEMATTL